MRVGAELREFVEKAWRDRDTSLNDLESRKLIAEVRGVELRTVEAILRHADGTTTTTHEHEWKAVSVGVHKCTVPGCTERKHEAHKPAVVAPVVLGRKRRRRRHVQRKIHRAPKTAPQAPLTDRESATLLCVAQCLVEGRDDEGSIRLTDRGRHVLAVLERYAT